MPPKCDVCGSWHYFAVPCSERPGAGYAEFPVGALRPHERHWLVTLGEQRRERVLYSTVASAKSPATLLRDLQRMQPGSLYFLAFSVEVSRAEHDAYAAGA